MATTSFESYQLQDGTFIYKINGIKVSQAEYNRKSAETKAKTEALKESAKKGQKDLLESSKKGQEDLLGISKEDYSKETLEDRKKRMFKEMESFKKGGVVKKKKINSKAIAKKYFKGIF